MVESALFAKLESFPKIANRDSHRLRELGDLLMEIRAAKQEERKSLLKQQGICFKCCSSIFHMAKNCDQDVKCSECGSVTHTAALHPGPAPWMKEPQFPTSEDHKVSEDVPVESEVFLSCTEVCGDDQLPRSCSKVCLVKVFPEGHPEKGSQNVCDTRWSK